MFIGNVSSQDETNDRDVLIFLVGLLRDVVFDGALLKDVGLGNGKAFNNELKER